jgi:DNA-binding transcriptional LysR family regulator
MLDILDHKWQLFIHLAELGSLARASVRLDIPPSVLSRQLAQLERLCGTRLFRRTGRGVLLTEFGEQVYPRVKAMLAEADVLADDIRSAGGVPFGEVRIGLLPSTVSLLAAPLFETVRQRFPKVRLHLVEANSTQLEEHLEAGRIDMSLLGREGGDEREDDTVLIRHCLRLTGRSGDPLLQSGEIRFADLCHLPLVLPSPPHPLRARLEKLARERSVRLNMAIEADTIRLQHAIAATGGGYAITAGGLPNISDEATALIIEPMLPRSVVLSATLRRPHTLATRALYRLLQDWAPLVLKE